MHIGILSIPSAVFWDDWALVDTSSEQILDVFRQQGSIFNFNGYLHSILMPLGIWSYKALTFLLMGLAGYMLNVILIRNGAFSQSLRWCIVLLFLLLPFNMARVALIVLPYTLCYAMFFGAWLAIDRHRMLAVILFFLSFNINSLLVFYALPILDMLFRSSGRFRITAWLKHALSRWELMILPFLFFGIKLAFYKPTGFYAGYNETYSLAVIPSTIATQAKDLFHLKFNIYLIVVFSLLIYIALKKFDLLTSNEEPKLKKNQLLILGGTAALLAVFPYWILGYPPMFTDWSSRHQLLMPLGVALIISGTLQYMPAKARATPLILILSACLSYGITSYFHFYIDWQKQLFIIDKFKNDPVIAHADLVIIKDDTKKFDAMGRTYRYYEWNGMLVRALGNDRRFAVELEDVSQYKQGKFDIVFHSHYKAGEHVRSAGESVAVVELNMKPKEGQNSFSRLTPKMEYTSRLLSQEEWNQMTAGSTDQSNEKQ